MLLPAVVKEIYPYASQTLSYVFASIIEGLKGTSDEEDKSYKRIKKWIVKMGVITPLKDIGFAEVEMSLHLTRQ